MSDVDEAAHAGARATYVVFIGTGFAFASWASRIPQVRDRLDLDPSQLGLVLLSIAAGALIALPLSGAIVHRFGSRRTVATMAAVDSAALAIIAIGYRFGVGYVVAGLFLFGFAQGAWDVAMNVQGAIVERRLRRAIMPQFHAGFSAGTVAGALLGAAMVAIGVPVTAHLLAVGVVVAVCVNLNVHGFVPDTDPADHDGADGLISGRNRVFAAWREPRTLLVGLFVLTFAFAEGTGNDWASIALIDDYHAPKAVGTLGFATFLAAMTAGRWFGPKLLDRYGRVPVVRTLAAVSVAGVMLFAFGQSTPIAFVGAVLWGVGLSLGFPVGMSAGADEPAMAAARVSVVASIGYCAFLGGPPLIGLLGDHFTVRRALSAVAVLLAVAILVAGSVRPIGASIDVVESAQDLAQEA